jgi:hypothetical protein
MKLDAHPLVVAVALGLLGPGALDGDEEEDPTCASCDRVEDPYAPGDEPDTDEIARVELEWSRLP